MNPQAGIVFVNGVTRQGTMSLLRHLRFPEIDDPQKRHSLCGRQRFGPAGGTLIFNKNDTAGSGAMTV